MVNSYADTMTNAKETINSLQSRMEETTAKISRDIGEIAGTLNSIGEDLTHFEGLCHNIMYDLYLAKISILQDEMTAIILTKEVEVFQKYQNALIELPWWKKFFKFQKKHIKHQIEREVGSSYQQAIDDIQAQIDEFSYENYSGQFGKKDGANNKNDKPDYDWL